MNKIAEVHCALRSMMNGTVSRSMYEKGLTYGLNYGVELPRLQQLASQMGKNHKLAVELWKENCRECRILAGLLMPTEGFDREFANLWMEETRFPEEVEMSVLNLYQHVSCASELAFEWIADERELYQYAGFQLLARLLVKNNKLSEMSLYEAEDQAKVALNSSSLLIRKAAQAVLDKGNFPTFAPANDRQ